MDLEEEADGIAAIYLLVSRVVKTMHFSASALASKNLLTFI